MRGVSRGIDRIDVVFDDPNLVANAGLLVPAALMVQLGLEALVNATVRLVGRVGGASPGRKVGSLVAAMLAGASHIDHANVLRAGATQAVLPFRVMAPSTLGTFSRAELLERYGPALGRPVVGCIRGSRFSNMKELRCSSGTEALGVADGTRKGELLSNLGVLVSYDPLTRRARVTCRPKVSESVVSEARHAHCGHGRCPGHSCFGSRPERSSAAADVRHPEKVLSPSVRQVARSEAPSRPVRGPTTS